jgi:hypothetical protein
MRKRDDVVPYLPRLGLACSLDDGVHADATTVAAGSAAAAAAAAAAFFSSLSYISYLGPEYPSSLLPASPAFVSQLVDSSPPRGKKALLIALFYLEGIYMPY